MYTGLKGQQGLRGPTGPQGPRGIADTRGQKGQRGVTRLRGLPGPTAGGVVYTRWGRTTCPSTSGTQLYCMLEGQLEVGIARVEVEQITSVYQKTHSTPPTLLGHRLDEHSCMGLSIRLEQVMLIAHFSLSITTISHVQYVMLQREELL